MQWPPRAKFPPRDWYDWGMVAIAIASAAVVVLAIMRIAGNG